MASHIANKQRKEKNFKPKNYQIPLVLHFVLATIFPLSPSCGS